MPLPASLSAAKVLEFIGIRGGIAIVLAIALGIVMWRADTISGKLEDKRDQLAAEQARHDITRASVVDLQNSLSVFVGAGKASKVAQLASIEAQAEDSTRLQAEADAIREEMATFGEGDPCDCRTPGSILNAEGI